MVLTEAARQVMLAVGEKYILPEFLKGNAYFALRNVNSSFHQFAFPVDVQIIHTIKKQKVRGEVCVIETETVFIQNDVTVATIVIDYVACDAEGLKDKESAMAAAVLAESADRDLAETYVDVCA